MTLQLTFNNSSRANSLFKGKRVINNKNRAFIAISKNLQHKIKIRKMKCILKNRIAFYNWLDYWVSSNL